MRRRVQHVGVDMSEIIRRTAKRMHDGALAGEQKLKEQESKWKYEQRESYVVLVRDINADRVSLAPSWTAITATEVESRGQVSARGDSKETALAELRYQLAHHYANHRLVKDWDEARDRAAKVELFVETVGGQLVSAGGLG